MSILNVRVASLAVALGITVQAQAGIIFQLSYSDPSGNAANGMITANDNSNGTFTAISGTLNITASTTPSAVGNYSLLPESGISPNGVFSWDSLMTYPGDPYLDTGGLLFSTGGNHEVNLWGNGPGNYSLYTWEAGLGYTLQYDGTATTSIVRVNADVATTVTGPTNVVVGGSLSYTITATNLGPYAASNVVVSDTLPAGVTFVSASGGGTNASGTVNWVITSFANAASTNFTVTVTAPTSGTLSNVVSSTASTFDPNASNNNGSAAGAAVTTTVNKLDQTISFGAIADQLTTNTVALYATASSGLTVTFAVTSGSASISNGTNLTFTAAGTVTITASQAGNTNWNAAPDVSRSFNVNGLPVPSSPTLERWPQCGVKVRGTSLLGTDPDGDAISFVSAGPSSAHGGTITTNATWVFYTPAAGFTNADSYPYVVSDSRGGTNGGTVTVNLSTNADLTPNYTLENLGGGSVRLHFSAIPGRTYAVQFTDTQAPANWQALTTGTADASGQFTCTDTPPSDTNSRLYRCIHISP